MSETTRESFQLSTLMGQIGNWLFKWRNLVLPLVLLGLLFGFRPVPLFGKYSADRWLDAAGILLMLVGEALRVATIGYTYIFRDGKGRKVYAEELAIRGVFAHCRNPLYLGNLAILTGLFVVHNNPWVYAIGLPTFAFFYAAIVASEEAYLRRRFGGLYEDYCRRVPRWIPRPRRLRDSVEGIRFNWEFVFYTEYGATYTWIVATLAILALKAREGLSTPQHHAMLQLLLSLFVLFTAVWAAWRHWKRLLRARKRQALA